MPLPILAITLGDPGGIGPEIAVKALADKRVYDICRPILVGTADLVKNALAFCRLDGFEVAKVDDPRTGRYMHGLIEVRDLENFPISGLKHKTITAPQGRASFEFVNEAINMALAKRVDGTVTGPINKAAINAGGFHYSGHTEIYAEKTGTKDYCMMLADGGFRVAHVSTHVSLREACDRVKKARVAKVIDLTWAALEKLDVGQPVIGVAGLNPHCGEGGLFGIEDDEQVRPAVVEAVARGLKVEGPIPADTVFSKMLGGLYDAVVVMYHDQGHIPTKLQGFKFDQATGVWGQMSGVNVTLGLPIVRTSVDHGTAFGKAGEGRANPQSLLDAVEMAAKLSS